MSDRAPTRSTGAWRAEPARAPRDPASFDALAFLGAGADARAEDLATALDQLRALYADVDARVAATTGALDLPCQVGCDACCRESVVVTPLEFAALWTHAHDALDGAARAQIMARGRALHDQHRDAIAALARSYDEALARALRFTCPLLGDAGACLVYAARPMLCRLFGGTFNDARGVYGCDLVGAHLGGRTVRLLPASGTARRLGALPWTRGGAVLPAHLARLAPGC